METSEIQLQLVAQYNAALAMLKPAIEACPESLWHDPKVKNKFWHVAYHALFYTHFYLQVSDKDFILWPKHQKDSNFLGARPWAPQEPLPAVEPYTREDLLEYHGLCREEIATKVPQIPLDAPSGFFWLPFNRLGVHLYNLRHLAHHTGQLTDRLRTGAGLGTAWVAQG